MGQQIVSEFTKYELSEDEKVTAAVLNPLQVQAIQTEKALIAEQIMALRYDPAHPFEFTQNDSFLKGQLAAYSGLLDQHFAASRIMIEEFKATQTLQSVSTPFSSL